MYFIKTNYWESSLKRLSFVFLLIFIFSISLNAQNDCHSGYPTISQDGRYIIFCSTMESENYQLYRADLDGTNIVRLTFSSENDLYPDASPNGKWIVFQRGAKEKAEIYRMDIDGQNLVRLTENSVYDGTPSFSPDSYSVAYASWDGSPYPEIFTMDVTGKNIKQLTRNPGATWYHNPVYSPDGNFIYMASGTNANNHIIRMTKEGKEWKDITLPNNFGYDESDFDINHDGSKIIFQTSEYHGYNNGLDIALINSDGTGWKQLSKGKEKEYYYAPCFNPKGGDNNIYFTHLQDLNSKTSIKKMTLDDLNVKTIIICKSVSVNEVQEEPDIHVFPNPVQDNIILNNTSIQKIMHLSLYDLHGNHVKSFYQRDILSGQLNISSLKNGYYILRFRGEKWKKNKFIIISK